MAQWAFLNDDFVKEDDALLHFRDLSIQRGYGVFDFFKVVNGVPVFLNEHLDRFYFSAEQMRLSITFSKNELKEICFQLLKKNGLNDCGVRITVTGGYTADGYQIGKPNLIIAIQSFSSPSKDQFEKGIRLVTYEHQRQLPHVKSIDYLMAIWLQPFLKQKEADDILYHQKGIISECPRSNIFMVSKDDKLITPSENILKGVVRNKLLEVAKNYVEVEERAVSLNEIKTAKEIFITSTTKTILPVSQIDDCILPAGKAVTNQLYNSMQALMVEELKQAVK